MDSMQKEQRRRDWLKHQLVQIHHTLSKHEAVRGWPQWAARQPGNPCWAGMQCGELMIGGARIGGDGTFRMSGRWAIGRTLVSCVATGGQGEARPFR